MIMIHLVADWIGSQIKRFFIQDFSGNSLPETEPLKSGRSLLSWTDRPDQKMLMEVLLVMLLLTLWPIILGVIRFDTIWFNSVWVIFIPKNKYIFFVFQYFTITFHLQSLKCFRVNMNNWPIILLTAAQPLKLKVTMKTT